MPQKKSHEIFFTYDIIQAPRTVTHPTVLGLIVLILRTVLMVIQQLPARQRNLARRMWRMI